MGESEMFELLATEAAQVEACTDATDTNTDENTDTCETADTESTENMDTEADDETADTDTDYTDGDDNFGLEALSTYFQLKEKQNNEAKLMYTEYYQAQLRLDRLFAQYAADMIGRRERYIQTVGVETALADGTNIPFGVWMKKKKKINFF